MDSDDSAAVVLFVAFALLLGVFCRSLAKVLNGAIPYTVILFMCGVIWGVIDDNISSSSKLDLASDTISGIDPHLFLQIFLPLLIFESAFSMKWHIFKRLLPQMMALAVVGVIIATALTAVILRILIAPSFSWEEALLLGAIVSATDPVAVVALLKELGGSAKLRTLIEGESLLNDGTAIVMVSVFIELCTGVELDGLYIVEMFSRLALGGIALGLAWGAVTIWVVGLVHRDVLVETTLTVSGVLAIVMLGASFVWYGKPKISPSVAHSLHEFWGTLAYFGETIVFILAGLLLANRIEFSNFTVDDYGRLVVLYLFLMIIRATMVLILSPFLVRFGYGFGVRRAAVLVYGGLRGAVALAMALVVELEEEISETTRNYVMFYGCGITFLTLVINAPTAGAFVRWLGLLRTSHAQEEQFVRGILLLSQKTKLSMQKVIDTIPEDHKSLCNWPKIEEFLSLSKLARTGSSNALLLGRTYAELSRVRTESSPGEDSDDSDDYDEGAALIPPVEDTTNLCCASLRRPMSNISPCEQRLQEARLRFLRGTLEALEGLLSSDALKALIAAEEAAEDRCHRPLSEWIDTLWPICKNPSWLAFLLKVNRLVYLDPILRWGINNSLDRAVRVASSYIEAHRRMLTTLRGSQDVMDRIRSESNTMTRMAKSFLEKATRKYSEKISQIYSELTANHLLSELSRNIHHLAGQGHFVDSELEILSKFIRDKQVDLLRGRNKFSPPTERDMLRISRLFALVGEDEFIDAIMYHDDIDLQKEAHLFAPDALNDYFYFVTSGALVYQHPEGYSQLLERGTFINVAEALAERPPLIKIIAWEKTKLVRFPGSFFRDACTGVFQQYTESRMQLVTNLAHLAGFHLFYLFGKEIFRLSTSPQLKALTKSKLMTTRIVREIVWDSEVILLTEGDTFQVENLGLILLGEISSADGNTSVFNLHGWQYCGNGNYICTSDVAIALHVGNVQTQSAYKPKASFHHCPKSYSFINSGNLGLENPLSRID
eukprot:gene3349-6020_t